MLQIALETKDDWWAVEGLYDLCFSLGRTALSSYRLREGIDPIAALCFTAKDTKGGYLAGAIRNWPVNITGQHVILLGPVAVHPTRQGEGVGGLLMRHVMQTARDTGWERLMLVGDYPYYSRFGFERLNNIEMPGPTNPDRILGYNLVPQAWKGISGLVKPINTTD